MTTDHEIQIAEAWGLRTALEPFTNVERLAAFEVKKRAQFNGEGKDINGKDYPKIKSRVSFQAGAKLNPSAKIIPMTTKGKDNGAIKERERT